MQCYNANRNLFPGSGGLAHPASHPPCGSQCPDLGKAIRFFLPFERKVRESSARSRAVTAIMNLYIIKNS